MAAPVTNLASVPHANVQALPWTFDIGTGEVVTPTNDQTANAGPQSHTGFNRWTVATAKSGGTSGPVYREYSSALTGIGGNQREASMWVRFSHAVTANLQMIFRQVAATVATNYCQYPNFENGLTLGWNVPVFGNAGGTSNVSTAQAQTGTKSYLNTFTSLATSGNWTVSTTVPTAMPVVPTNQVTLSVYVRPSVTITITPAADFYIVATNTSVSSVPGTGVSCPANTWTRLTVTATAPATSTGVRLSLSALAATFGAAGTIFIDSAQFEFGGAATAYFDNTFQDDAGVDYSLSPQGYSVKTTAGAGQTVVGVPQAVAANTWTRLAVPGTASANYIGMEAQVIVAAASIIPVGGWYDATDMMIQSGNILTSFFSPLYDELAYWSGVENASTSIIYYPVITATADSSTARMILTATDGPPLQVAYVIRRDTQGSTLVRETSTGVITYDAGGTFTVNDYEARQGLSTNYLLTAASGIQVANTTVIIPRWGTWIKNPGKPFMNMRVLWNSDNEYSRAARRELIPIRGAKFPVAHTDRRLAPSGTIKLATQTTAEAKAFTNLIDDGAVLMIDVNPDFGVPIRYVSLGDVVGRRAGKEDRDLTWEARIWELQVDETSAPIGIPAGQTVTYEAIPASFDSYISLAASVATYNDLAAGNWS